MYVKDPKYDHIEGAEKERVNKEAEQFEKYLSDAMKKQDALAKNVDPYLTSADIQKRKTVSHRIITPRHINDSHAYEPTYTHY